MLKKHAMCRLLLLAGCLSLLGGCKDSSSNAYGPASAPAVSTQPNTVLISGMTYGPGTITAATNVTITWQNNDSMTHTATSDHGAWDTGDIPPGGTKTLTFTAAGMFAYHCTRHPGMTATVVVQ